MSVDVGEFQNLLANQLVFFFDTFETWNDHYVIMLVNPNQHCVLSLYFMMSKGTQTLHRKISWECTVIKVYSAELH